MTQLSNLYGSINAENTNLYLKTIATTFGIPRDKVQLWNSGLTVNSATEIRVFDDAGTGGVPYYAPNAGVSNIISMGATPVGDANWEVFSAGTGAGGAGQALFARYIATTNQTLFAIPSGASFIAENLEVYVGGTRQAPGIDYMVNGQDVELTTPADDATVVDIYSFYTRADGDFSFAAPVIANYVGTGSQTQYSLVAANLDSNGIFISIDGVQQSNSRDFTYNSVQNLITFNLAPPNGAYIDIRAFAPYVVGTPLPAPVVVPTLARFTGNGSSTNFAVPGSPVADSGTMDVYIDGVAQSSISDYGYSNGVLIFSTPPPNNAQIDAKIYSNTIVNQSNSFVTATGASVARTLGNRFSDIRNIKDFGAKGDAVTNDENAFIAAGAGPVFVPTGSYVVPIGNDYSSNVYFSFGVVTIIGNTTFTIKDLLI